MATSKLTLYLQSGMKPENNYIVEDIREYLRLNAESTLVKEGFQYIRDPAKSQQFKVDIAQSAYNEAVFDYASLEQDGDIYYYFIVDATWKSQNCLGFTAVLDTLNTFQDQYGFTDRSHIERQHVDRFKLIGARPTGDSINEVVWNVISDTKEELQPELVKSREEVMQGALPVDSKYTWYLIYQTKQGEGTTVGAGSPEIVCCADRDIELNPGSTSTDTHVIEPRMLLDHSYVAFGKLHIQFKTTGNISHDEDFEGYIAVFTDGTEPAKVNINFSYYNGLVSYNGPIEGNLTFVLDHLLILYESPGQNTYTLDQAVVMKTYPWTAYGRNDTLLGIQSVDRTNSYISKVIECPYCPLDIKFSPSGKMIVPIEWNFRESDGKLYCDNLSYNFPTRQVDYDDLALQNIVAQSIKADRNKLTLYSRNDTVQDKEGNVMDPKTKISTLASYSYVYDDNVWTLVPENLLPSDDKPETHPGLITVNYKQSNNISSECGFKFELPTYDYIKTEYFDNYMFSVRNNELPLYYSEYINYIRNGYNYDQKQNWNTTKGNIASIFTQVVSAGLLGASMAVSSQDQDKIIFRPDIKGDYLDAFSKGNDTAWLLAAESTSIRPQKGVGQLGFGEFSLKKGGFMPSGFSVPSLVSNAVGIGSGIYNTIKTHYQGEEAIKQKVNEARAKSFSVSTTNNLDLFKWYSGNKVVAFRFEPRKDIQKLINDYFSRYGYSRGYYEKPDLDSRLFFNYCRGTVDIDNYKKRRSIEENKADIVQKFRNGVYKIHKVNTPLGTYWDMKLERQNYERSILPVEWCE